MMLLYPLFVVSYFLGSIPTALMAGYFLGGIDIRTIGSGNAGATNLYRVFGIKPYIAVLSFDIIKGYVATAWISKLFPNAVPDPLWVAMLCGLAAVLGHIYSVFARFRGGKGVATAAGVMLAIAPGPLCVAVGVYIIIMITTNFVSLGSIGAALSIPFSLAVYRYGLGEKIRIEVYGLSILLAVLILATHRSNIGRLLKGEEKKTFFFNKKKRDG